MRAGLNAVALLILVTGLAAGLIIYLYADDEPMHPAIYEMSVSKTYMRELQRFGGKTAVLFDDLGRWFTGLWQGKSLGVTVAALSIGASLCVLAVSRRMK